jgi:hypothetical protein
MSSLDYEEVLKYAMGLIAEAESRGVAMRILGSVAIRLHCQKYAHLFEKASRPVTDLDVLAYSRNMKPLTKLIHDRGLVGDERLIAIYGERRQIYDVPEIEGLKIDIFFDKLDFCHPIPFENRLELDSPTITMTDVLLEKMQIVEINPKDLKDTIILFLEHDLSQGFERESIDASYVARLLSADWGFQYTVVRNLQKTIDFMKDEPFIEPADMQIVEGRVTRLLDDLERSPKTLKWKLRAKLGTSVKWYREVEETGQAF